MPRGNAYRMIPFEQIDISGDAGIRAFGRSPAELFVNAALGMYGLITDLSRVQTAREIEITAESGSREGLLVAWLNEFVFHFDAYGFIAKDIIIHDLDETGIRAVARGEDFDPGRHEGKLLIKAATYHKLKIEEKEGIWIAEIIFDI